MSFEFDLPPIPTEATATPVEVARALIHQEKDGRDGLFTKFVSILLTDTAPPEERAKAFGNAMSNRDYTPGELLEFLNECGAGPEAHVAAAFDGHYEHAEHVQVIGSGARPESVAS